MSAPSSPVPAGPWCETPETVLARLQSDAEAGLTVEQAAARLARHGRNELRRIARRGIAAVLWDQFATPIVALLVVAATLAFAFGERLEGLAIVAVIVLNAALGFVTELRALASMEALRRLGSARTRVRRGGREEEVDAETLVPGDLVILDAGDRITADLRLVSGSRLQADESALTGESMPVAKDATAVDASAALPERSSMLYKGTALTRGSGEAVVVGTGMETELGHISALVARAEAETTPLERRLRSLAHRLIGVTLLVGALVAVAMLVSGREPFLALELAIALAVAAIPEGLPIVATIALARGMWRMARRNVLIERLGAVETLGSTTVVLVDKTGTLTENRMTVVTLELACGAVRVEGTGLAPEGAFRLDGRVVDPEALPPLAAALDVGVLCNNASYDAAAAAGTGDPMELALLVAGTKGGRDRDALRAARPELAEHAFDPETRRMATLHRDGDGILAAVKGAPESLLPCCSTVLDAQGPRPLDAEARADWLRRADALAARGERVLVVARQRPPSVDAFAFRELELLGLVGFLDPPRPTVPAAVAACDAAGVRLVMVTGDHGATAWSIAGAVGLVPDRDAVEGDWEDARVLGSVAGLDGDARARLLERRVVARATPEQKLDLIRLHQAAGHVVAMTGDGVNDAPALRQADIGIAMGKRGTQVAREAAAMVLRDDELGSIVVAIAEGRAIFANIRKFVVYLMSCNVSEILAVGVAAVAMGPLPLLPLQILFLNLVTDVFPALALGVCRGHPGLMDRPPRPRGEAVLTAAQWRAIAGYGASIAVTVLAMLVIASQLLGVSDAEATTLTFTTLALAQLWHVFTMRDEASGLLRNEVTGNGWVWAAIGLCLALVALALGWTPLATILGLEPPSEGLGLAVLLSFVPAVLGQAGIAFRSRRKLRRASA